MSASMDIVIKEATSYFATEILAFTMQVGGESANLTFDERGVLLSVKQEEILLETIQESPYQVMLLALEEPSQKIIGIVSITVEEQERVKHVGELGISVLKDYWGYGIGTLLMEECLHWVKESGVLHRIELDVRVDNKRAIALYEQFGFEIEGTLHHAMKVNHEYIDVYRMALLV